MFQKLTKAEQNYLPSVNKNVASAISEINCQHF